MVIRNAMRLTNVMSPYKVILPYTLRILCGIFAGVAWTCLGHIRVVFPFRPPRSGPNRPSAARASSLFTGQVFKETILH